MYKQDEEQNTKEKSYYYSREEKEIKANYLSKTPWLQRILVWFYA